MHAVFLDTQTFHSSINFSAIENCVTQLTCFNTTTPDQLLSRVKDADIIITNKVVIDKTTLSQLPQLKLICISATGTNNVDLVSARHQGITVTNVSGYAAPSLGQYVIAQILNYFCNLAEHNQVTQRNVWQQSPTFCVHGSGMSELSSKTLGIYGYGTLGQTVGKLAEAFGMKVLVAEHANAKTIRKGRVSFNDMLSNSDVVSLHCPQTPNTTELFDKATFEKMKSHALLINTARGGVVHSQDLADALKQKLIGHAILDVLDQEPPSPDHPLLDPSLSNVTITAHMAWASFEAQQRLIALLAKNIQDFQQNIATNVVN